MALPVVDMEAVGAISASSGWAGMVGGGGRLRPGLLRAGRSAENGWGTEARGDGGSLEQVARRATKGWGVVLGREW